MQSLVKSGAISQNRPLSAGRHLTARWLSQMQLGGRFHSNYVIDKKIRVLLEACLKSLLFEKGLSRIMIRKSLCIHHALAADVKFLSEISTISYIFIYFYFILLGDPS